MGRQHLLLTNYQCRIWISFLELEALVNGWWYAKHVSYIRVTICLCAAINLGLDVDCSRFALSYPSYCPPTLTSCCNNGNWPPHRWLSAKRGQQKGPVDPYTHTHCLTYNDKRQHTQSWGRQRASWSMTNCSPRQQAPVLLSWGTLEISHRVTQFHHVSPSTSLLCCSLSSAAHPPAFTQTKALGLKFSCNKAILTSL